MGRNSVLVLASLVSALAMLGGCKSGGNQVAPAEAASSSATMISWERCLVPVTPDSSLRDLPPFPYRDPGPNGITVSGTASRRSGPLNHDPDMTLADALTAAQVPPNTPVVVWRCENGAMHPLRMRPDAQLAVHDWVVAPDPASAY